MLPKQFRLRKTKDFDLVWKNGRSFFVKQLGTKSRKNGLEESRFGFVVSTKISKRAVVRNRIKRLLRQSIHQNLDKIKSGFDIVFFTRPGVEKYDKLEKIEPLVLNNLAKLNLLK